MVYVRLDRYYGDVNVTKSRLSIVKDGEALFECEARELGFADYTDDEKKLGMQYKCLPRGEFPLKVVSMPFNPSCLKTHHTHKHRGTVVYGDADVKRKSNAVLIGYAYETTDPRTRSLRNVEECRDRFNEVVSELWGEEFRLVVSNQKLIMNNESLCCTF